MVASNLLNAATHVLARLPPSWTSACGRAIGTIMAALGNRTTDTIRTNLAWANGGDLARARQMTPMVIRDGVVTLLDSLSVLGANASLVERRISGVDGLEHLTSAYEEGRGLIIIAPHLGNWELLNRFLAARVPMTAMYRPARIRELDPVLIAARQRDGATLVPANAAGLRRLVQTLRGGGVIGILPDQVPERGNGVYAPFFGQPALTMTLVGRLLRASGCAAVMAAALREKSGNRYRIVIEPAPATLADSDAAVGAAALNSEVAELVCRAPTQYQWAYKRFKRQPAGAFRYYR